MTNVLNTLEERGFVYQTTDDPGERQRLREILGGPGATFYLGIDPTASSLHVGNFVQLMAVLHLQRAGHRPLLVVGGGTGRIGDPSGKTEMRRLHVHEQVDANLAAMRAQLGKYLELREGAAAVVLDNAAWLSDLNYLEFLREIGRHFSVNRMLAHDCFKSRLSAEAGLSFLEFNYMLLQAYDFLVLFREYGCTIQTGGSDQWGNIVAGVELIRRVEGKEAFGVTIPLLTTPAGQKMGKTEKGAVWMDPALTSPYEYYQFWINTADAQVGRLLRMFTFLDLARIAELERLEGAQIREAKETLAFEATAIAHGADAAERARAAAKSLFGAGASQALDNIPTYSLAPAALDAGLPLFVICADAKLCASRGDARRLARQGGLYLNDEKVPEDRVVTAADLRPDGSILVRAGKKRYLRVLPG